MATCGSFIIAEKKDLDNLLYKEYHVLNPTKYGNLQGRVKVPTGGIVRDLSLSLSGG